MIHERRRVMRRTSGRKLTRRMFVVSMIVTSANAAASYDGSFRTVALSGDSAPGTRVEFMDLSFVVLEVKCDIRHMKRIIRKVFFHHIPLIAAADNKFIDAVRRITLHDVPEDRLAANFYHWLWFQHRLLRQACPGATG